MEIYSMRPRYITCINNKDNKFGCNGDNHLLEVGKKYWFEHMIVHGSYTEVFVKEFPFVAFNSVCFEEVEYEICDG